MVRGDIPWLHHTHLLQEARERGRIPAAHEGRLLLPRSLPGDVGARGPTAHPHPRPPSEAHAPLPAGATARPQCGESLRALWCWMLW